MSVPEPELQTSRVARFAAPLTFVAALALALVRLAFNPGFYFADDTQFGTAGILRHLGQMVANGQLQILNPHAWQAGNYLAEGQWGLLNPFDLAIAWGSLAVDDVAMYITIVKVVVLGLFALGTYLLARTFQASALWAAVLGVAASAAGFTVYMDSPSWISGLFNVAAFSFTWWGLRRIEQGRGPLAFLLSAYLLVTFGYVFGVMMLVIVLLISLVQHAIARAWPTFWRVLLAALFAGLLTITIYLPGVLTAPVTERGTTSILQQWFLNADLSDFGAAITPTGTASIGSWYGSVTSAPMMYIWWALPFALLAPAALRMSWRKLLQPLVFAAVVATIVLGPSQIGPIRWPVRLMPYVVVGVCVVVAVLLTVGLPKLVTKRGAYLAVVAALLCTWLAWTQTPTSKWLVAVSAVLLLVTAAMAWWALRAAGLPAPRQKVHTKAMAVIVGAMTAVLVALQMLAFPATPLPTFAVPHSAAQLSSVLDSGVDDGLTVGDVYADAGASTMYQQRLAANLWYFSGTQVSNLYTVLPYSNYVNDLCMDLRGSTCTSALGTLLSTDQTTGMTVSDLLGVNTIVTIPSSFTGGVPATPTGWTLASSKQYATTFTRNVPVPTAGSLAWSGPGTSVQVVSQSDTAVTVRVGAVGSDARLVFRRLAWPGYSVSGAELASPVRGYLLTVNLASAKPGDVVTVTFRPPGFGIELVSFALAAGILLGWPISRFMLRRRRSGDARD